MGVPDECDVVVAGGGPVGAALAVSLRGCGLTVALVEPPTRPLAAFRPIALSHGSRIILERIGAFHKPKYCAIETIHVSQAGGFGRTVMRAADEALPALGYVCDGGELAATLLEAAAAER